MSCSAEVLYSNAEGPGRETTVRKKYKQL